MFTADLPHAVCSLFGSLKAVVQQVRQETMTTTTTQQPVKETKSQQHATTSSFYSLHELNLYISEIKVKHLESLHDSNAAADVS